MYGDSLKDNIVAIVVLDPERFKKYCEEKGKTEGDESLIDDALKEIVMKDMVRLAKLSELSSLEKPKDICL